MYEGCVHVRRGRAEHAVVFAAHLFCLVLQVPRRNGEAEVCCDVVFWLGQIQKNYLSTEDFNVDRVNNASKACGPLCAWVISQVHYSSILDKVQPLRDEVVRLEEQMVELERQQQISSDVISTLEASIEQYKKVRTGYSLHLFTHQRLVCQHEQAAKQHHGVVQDECWVQHCSRA